MLKIMKASTFQSSLEKAFGEGKAEAADEQTKFKAQCTIHKKEELRDKVIIAVTNSNEELYIGRVTGFLDEDDGDGRQDKDLFASTSIIPRFYDFIRNKELFMFGAFRLYTPQLFTGLLKLTREERAALLFNNLYSGRRVEFDKNDVDPLSFTLNEIKEKLAEHNFNWETGGQIMRRGAIENFKGFYYVPLDSTGLIRLTLAERALILSNQGIYTVNPMLTDSMLGGDLVDLICTLDNSNIPTHRDPDAVIPGNGSVPLTMQVYRGN